MNNNTVSVKMSAHQLALARMHVTFVLPLKTRSAAFILAGTLLLVILVNLIYEDAGRFESLPELLTGALLLGGTWLLLIYRRESGKDAVTRFYADGFEISLLPEGLKYQRGEESEILEWDKFTHMTTTSRWLFFYFGRNAALIVPRRSFRDQEHFEFWRESAAGYLAAREKR